MDNISYKGRINKRTTAAFLKSLKQENWDIFYSTHSDVDELAHFFVSKSDRLVHQHFPLVKVNGSRYPGVKWFSKELREDEID